MDEVEIVLEEKYQRIEALIENRMLNVLDPVVKKIYKEFGKRIFRRSSAPIDYSQKILRRCMEYRKVKTALEIGTLNGIVTAVMTQFCNKVITLDIEDLEAKYEIWDFLDIRDKIDFYLIRNELEKEKILKRIDFDFAFVDGDHTHCTWSDFMMTRKCKRLLFHEAIRDGNEVDKLLKSLPGHEVEYFDRGDKRIDLGYWSKR